MKESIINILKGNLFKETFIYTATDMIGKAMAFILLPIVSFYMPPAELGIATNFTVLTGLIILLSGMAIVNSLFYFFYEQNKDENNQMVSNSIILCIILSCTICFIMIICHHLIETYLMLGWKIQLLSMAFVIGSLISQTNLNVLRLENKAKQYAVLQVSQIVLHAIVVLYFVVYLKGGGIGKINAEVLVFSFMGCIHFAFLMRKGYLKLKVSLVWMKKLLSFGLPLLPHSLSFWLKGGMDKVFITTYCGLQYNGLYSMALSISTLYTMLIQSFFNAYTPYVQKRLSTDDISTTGKNSIVKQIYCIIFVFGIVGILSLGGCWFIFNYIIDTKYLPAFGYLPIIILANFIHTFYSFTIQFIYKVKKTFVMGIITFSGSLLQMLLTFWLIKIFGVMGAAYSLLLGNIIITAGIMTYSNKVYPMPWFSFLTKRI